MISNNGESAGEQEMREARLAVMLLARHKQLLDPASESADQFGTDETGSLSADAALSAELAGLESCLRALEDVRRGAIEQSYAASTHASAADRTWPKVPSQRPAVNAAAEVKEKRSGRIGRFEIIRELGRGGLGVVLLAKDPVLNRHVAIKIPRPEAMFTPQLRQRFTREAEAASRLTHPNIVPIYDSGEVGPICFIAAAYVDGPSLAEWLKTQTDPIDPRLAARIVADLAEAMNYAHGQGILHRDLKPSNVLLEPISAPAFDERADNGTAWTPKITDFGLAKILDRNNDDTRSGAILGTPAYMSPEQAKAQHGQIGLATDVYALGAILYELIAGSPVFRGRSDAETLWMVACEEPIPPRRRNPNCPQDLEAICLTCLEKAPARRYESAGELAADLRRFLAREPTQARPLSKVQRSARWVAQNRRVAALLATIALMLCGVTAVSLVAALRINEARDQAEQSLTRANASAAENERLAYIGRLRIASDAIKRSHFDEARAQLTAAYGTDGNLAGFDWAYLWGEVTKTRWLDAPGAEGKRQRMYQLQFTADGRWLVGGQESGKIFIWDAHTGRLVHEIQAHTSCANAFSFTPDGQIMASASCDKTVKLWDTKSWQQIGAVLEHPDKVQCCCFSSDGRLLATGSDDADSWRDRPAKFCVWDMQTKTLLAQLAAERRGLVNLLYSKPLKQFVAVNARGAIERFDMSGDCPTPMRPLESDASTGHHTIFEIALAPNGLSAAVARPEFNRIDLWNLATEQVAEVSAPVAASGMSFLPDGQRLILYEGGLGSWNGQLVIRNLQTQESERAWFRPGIPPAFLSISPDGQLLASSDGHGRVSLDNLGPSVESPYRWLRIPTSLGSGVDYCEALGLCFELTRPDFRLTFRDSRTGDPVKAIELLGREVSHPVLSPTGERLYVYDTAEHCGWLLDLSRRSEPIRIPFTPAFGRPAFSPDGRSLAGFDDSWNWHIVDSATGQTLHSREDSIGKSARPVELAFRNDGTAVAIPLASGSKVIDLPATEIRAFGSGATFIRFSPDDRLVLRLGEAGQCDLSDARNGERLSILEGCEGGQAGDFTPDGKIVAVAGGGGRISLFSVPSGAHLLELPSPGPYHDATSCQFSKDGNRLIVMWRDRTMGGILQEFHGRRSPPLGN